MKKLVYLNHNFLQHLVMANLCMLIACHEPAHKQSKKKNPVVEIKKEQDGTYQLYRHGKPFFVKGGGGYTNFKQLKKHGGNSIRVWDTYNAQQILDKAHKEGLTVTLCLEVGRPREGFDYSDETAVARQLQELRKTVRKHKNHPALLAWIAGNEVHLLRKNNIKVWKAINEIAKMIHEEDPDHPVTTTLAGIHTDLQIVQAKLFCPELDFISINIFGGIERLKREMGNYIWGWNGPYMVTEWGALGWWDVPYTTWGAPFEQNSSEKGQYYLRNYLSQIKNNDGKCLGSYVFYWGQKQERTHTLFSMFLQDSIETNMVESMHYAWKNQWPENRCPSINYIHLNELTNEENVFLLKREDFVAYVDVTDAENENLHFYWEIRKEGDYSKITGGDKERKPELIISKNRINKPHIEFTAPHIPGPYRLFVYVYDSKNHVSTANIPFYVLDEDKKNDRLSGFIE